jgi:two-component system cell cycle response regulator
LKSVAGVIRGQLRTEDAFARYGGEEFVIVLRDTALPQAALVAERVRDKVGKSPIDIGGPSDSTIHVTISAGCASLECSADASIEELVGVADRRLYRAKRSGRNCVVANDDSGPAAR